MLALRKDLEHSKIQGAEHSGILGSGLWYELWLGQEDPLPPTVTLRAHNPCMLCICCQVHTSAHTQAPSPHMIHVRCMSNCR